MSSQSCISCCENETILHFGSSSTNNDIYMKHMNNKAEVCEFVYLFIYIHILIYIFIIQGISRDRTKVK